MSIFYQMIFTVILVITAKSIAFSRESGINYHDYVKCNHRLFFKNCPADGKKQSFDISGTTAFHNNTKDDPETMLVALGVAKLANGANTTGLFFYIDNEVHFIPTTRVLYANNGTDEDKQKNSTRISLQVKGNNRCLLITRSAANGALGAALYVDENECQSGKDYDIRTEPIGWTGSSSDPNFVGPIEDHLKPGIACLEEGFEWQMRNLMIQCRNPKTVNEFCLGNSKGIKSPTYTFSYWRDRALEDLDVCQKVQSFAPEIDKLIPKVRNAQMADYDFAVVKNKPKTEIKKSPVEARSAL